MFFNKEKKKSPYSKAHTPESRKRQRAAIIEYYTNKRNSTKSTNKKSQ
jgi:hypothetical protein